MRIRLNPAVLGLLVLSLPVAALADITGTPTLSANTALNLDTGATASSGGDLLWSGTALTPQSKAVAYTNASLTGASTYAQITGALLSGFASLGTNAAIPASSLSVGAIVGVKTNGGNYAALLVTALSGTSITFQFTTFTGSSTPSGPTITEVENGYNGVPAGFSNSGVARGSIFFVLGTGLAGPLTAPLALQNSSIGLPTTVDGATMKVTVGSTTVTPALYWAQPTGVSGVLPSNTPLGSGTVTVTYNSQTSNAYPITVVANATGFATVSGGGTGPGWAVDPLNGYTAFGYSHSIPPGTTVVLWGSGLGADPKGTGGNTAAGNRDSIYVPVTSVAADSINALTDIYIGGVDAGAPAYQGAFGFPGLNQFNIKIPNNAPTGCNISVVGVNAQGIPTNVITLPIGNGVCSDATGITGSQLSSTGGDGANGFVGILQLTMPATSGGGTTVTPEAVASFSSTTGSVSASSASQLSVGSCVINQSATAATSTGTTTGLDAGTITVSNPSGTVVSVPDSFSAGGTTITETGFYFAQLAAGYIPTTGGTFTFKGTGGTSIGPFTTNVTFPNPVLTWSNQSAAATVTRASGLNVAWTGGASGTYVIIGGTSTAASGAYGGFTCIAPISAGQFTVPVYILQALPAGTGDVLVENSTNFTSFTATGLPNGGNAVGYVGTQVNTTFN